MSKQPSRVFLDVLTKKSESSLSPQSRINASKRDLEPKKSVIKSMLSKINPRSPSGISLENPKTSIE